MSQISFLFDPKSGIKEQSSDELPDFFVDLNLNQVEAALFSGLEAYKLTDVFRFPLHDVRDVHFRQSLTQDLERSQIRQGVDAFLANIKRVRDCQARLAKAYYRRQKEWWLLEAIGIYATTVSELHRTLAREQHASPALGALADYLAEYIAGSEYTGFTKTAKDLRGRLRSVRYTALIRGLRVDVRNEVDARDYGAEVLEVFDRFRQGEVSRYSFEFRDDIEMNHVEAQILEGVARLNRDLFDEIGKFYDSHQSFIDSTVERFDREIQFYVTYLNYISPLRAAGLPFSYPSVEPSEKDSSIKSGFDLALAQKLNSENRVPILNDFELKEAERILVVSGPNQGGKTTFARMVGQVHYLAALGYPVACSSAHLALPGRIFTHFERQEQIQNLRGKLEDDIFRIHAILESASADSLVLINEMFTSTSLRDAIFLSKRVADLLLARGSRCVWVTFLDELSRIGPETVSMTSMVNEHDTAERTFKVIRRPADGHAYAMSIAEKYHLTFDNILERMHSESTSSVS
jgi:DNA mismatch repair protein MutS